MDRNGIRMAMASRSQPHFWSQLRIAASPGGKVPPGQGRHSLSELRADMTLVSPMRSVFCGDGGGSCCWFVFGILESLALAGRREMSCPLGMLGTPIVHLALDVFGLVPVSVCWQDLHPFWAIILLLSFALFGSVFDLAFLLLLLRFLLFLLQLLDLSFQGKDLLLFWRGCVPSFGLPEGLELVVGKEHEHIWLDLCSFLVFVFLFANVGDKFLVQYGLVHLEEICQEVICCFPPSCQRVDQVLDIGIKLGNVTVDGQDVGVCEEIGAACSGRTNALMNPSPRLPDRWDQVGR